MGPLLVISFTVRPDLAVRKVASLYLGAILQIVRAALLTRDYCVQWLKMKMMRFVMYVVHKFIEYDSIFETYNESNLHRVRILGLSGTPAAPHSVSLSWCLAFTYGQSESESWQVFSDKW